MRTEVLVLGLGNPLLGDEGLGPRAIQALEEAYRFPPEVQLLDGGTAGLSLLSEVTAVERLLVLDAIRTGASPGTVVSLDESALGGARGSALGPHDIGVSELLSAARFHGGPGEAVLLGIEPERLELGSELSPAVIQSLPRLMAAVIERLGAWGIEAEEKA